MMSVTTIFFNVELSLMFYSAIQLGVNLLRVKIPEYEFNMDLKHRPYISSENLHRSQLPHRPIPDPN